jgi:hypothetical protein
VLPHNMGRVHRSAYLAIGVAMIVAAILQIAWPPAVRLAAGVVGLMALASSLTGFCLTCYTLGISTRKGRRVP